MNKTVIMLALVFVFMLGWLASAVISDIQPSINLNFPLTYTITGSGNERASPSDWVNEREIIVSKDQVIIKVANATLAEFADTNSMDPLLDKGTNGIEIVPKSADDVNTGDIIAFKSSYGTIIHRVIEKGFDEQGAYFITKGDNNKSADPDKIRFEQIELVLVALIY
jgi:hypothetical protein